MASASGLKSDRHPALLAKQHFEVLDGLRGVAALMILVHHIQHTPVGLYEGDPLLPHAYLAVDFFFVLSGFVIGYAFDDRWGRGMSLWQFFRQRLVRLHPLVVLGALLGFLALVLDPIAGLSAGAVSIGHLLLALGLSMFLLPHPAIEGRWNSTHSLDVPSWSLFQEYLANIAYALVLRRLSVGWLVGIGSLGGVVLMGSALHFGSLDHGFSWDSAWMAPVRLTYPFIAGLLLYRLRPHWPKMRLGFGWLSLLLVGGLAMPTLPQYAGIKLNAVYEVALVLTVFPALVIAGAHSRGGSRVLALCRESGRISYPLYITHAPFMFLWASFLAVVPLNTWQTVVAGIGVAVLTLAIARIAIEHWDRPLRAWLDRPRDRSGREPAINHQFAPRGESRAI